MTDEFGRGPLRDLSTEGRISVWRKMSGWVREEVLHKMGRPAKLENFIASGRLSPHPITSPADTFWTRSVVYWEDWMEASSSSYNSRSYTLDYRKPGYERRLESHSLAVPEVKQLIHEDVIHDFTCDITDIRGISASKSGEHDIRDIDDFPLLRSPELAEPVTEEHLLENMRHAELRLDRMRFAEYPWTERRFYWWNDGGSHHFGSARYQACRLSIPILLTGKLYRYSVNTQMIAALRDKWHFFAIPAKEVFGSFFDAMNAFECPFGNSELPRHMHHTEKNGAALRLIWLDRNHPKATTVARVLSASGFPDFGARLAALAKSGS
uniref:DUF6685 family protein n=1 Tax=Scandinavium goeteborgense TaxID=1851514 RepID=UPI00135B8318|nr:DUF6685 family protein [Scandinavium goeteborgense]